MLASSLRRFLCIYLSLPYSIHLLKLWDTWHLSNIEYAECRMRKCDPFCINKYYGKKTGKTKHAFMWDRRNAKRKNKKRKITWWIDAKSWNGCGFGWHWGWEYGSKFGRWLVYLETSEKWWAIKLLRETNQLRSLVLVWVSLNAWANSSKRIIETHSRDWNCIRYTDQSKYDSKIRTSHTQTIHIFPVN